MYEIGPYEAFWIFVGIFFISSLIVIVLGWILSNKRESSIKEDMFDCGQKPDVTPHKIPIFGSIRYFAYAMAFFVLDAFVWIILASVYPFKICSGCFSIFFLLYIGIILVGLSFYINRVMEAYEE